MVDDVTGSVMSMPVRVRLLRDLLARGPPPPHPRIVRVERVHDLVEPDPCVISAGDKAGEVVLELRRDVDERRVRAANRRALGVGAGRLLAVALAVQLEPRLVRALDRGRRGRRDEAEQPEDDARAARGVWHRFVSR